MCSKSTSYKVNKHSSNGQLKERAQEQERERGRERISEGEKRAEFSVACI